MEINLNSYVIHRQSTHWPDILLFPNIIDLTLLLKLWYELICNADEITVSHFIDVILSLAYTCDNVNSPLSS